MTTSLAHCETIQDVIDQLDRIIDHCKSKHNKLGYFAALYRDVTVRVQQGIAAGRFEDSARIERLDVTFANRYLEALDSFWNGKDQGLTRSWREVFKDAHLGRPTILQHLLLGMNVHINLDLAIAAAQTSPGDQLALLKRDFDEITVLLDEMIRDVQHRIDQVSPWIRIIDAIGARTDQEICAFAILEARELAWKTAENLSRLDPDQFAAAIIAHDAVVAAIGEEIRSPGWPLNVGLHIIRIRERHKIAKVITVLQLK